MHGQTRHEVFMCVLNHSHTPAGETISITANVEMSKASKLRHLRVSASITVMVLSSDTLMTNNAFG
jgi:hypothetical protein